MPLLQRTDLLKNKLLRHLFLLGTLTVPQLESAVKRIEPGHTRIVPKDILHVP